MGKFAAAVSVLTVWLTPQLVAACECPPTEELEPALKAASLVFVGRVEEQKSSAFKKGQKEVKINVFKKFKGFEDVPRSDFVLVHTPEDTCGYPFQNGFEYLVFADGTPANLRATKCSRTQLLDDAMLDQQRLIRLTGQ